jgi:hypothetical protein
MSRARAEQMAAAGQRPQAAPRPARGSSDRRAAVDAMTSDVKMLVGAGALVMILGLGWMVFGPAPLPPAPVLGSADPGPPKRPKAEARSQPAFKLPWWK